MITISDDDLAVELSRRGTELASELAVVLGERFGSDDLAVEAKECIVTHELTTPPGLPNSGALIAHRGEFADARSEDFTLAWFVSEPTVALLDRPGDESETEDRLESLAVRLADVLQSDKLQFESHDVQRSADLWNDYILQSAEATLFWSPFEYSLAGETNFLWLAWPHSAAARLCGPEPEVESEEASEGQSQFQPEETGDPPVALKNLPAGARRILRTEVPVLVTLAMKDIPASRLLDIGPGTIIEFERGCDQPLVLSVNNLPIGMGEAVKIGDHFGLKVTGILSKEERAARVGGKWKFG